MSLLAMLLGLNTIIGTYAQVDTIPTESLGDNLRGSVGLTASF